MSRHACDVCNNLASHHVWGVSVCARDYFAWAADLPGRCSFVRESLTPEQYAERSTAQAREWLARRKARAA